MWPTCVPHLVAGVRRRFLFSQGGVLNGGCLPSSGHSCSYNHIVDVLEVYKNNMKWCKVLKPHFLCSGQ